MLGIGFVFAFCFGLVIIISLLTVSLMGRISESVEVRDETIEGEEYVWQCLECREEGKGRKFISRHKERTGHEKFDLF